MSKYTPPTTVSRCLPWCIMVPAVPAEKPAPHSNQPATTAPHNHTHWLVVGGIGWKGLLLAAGSCLAWQRLVYSPPACERTTKRTSHQYSTTTTTTTTNTNTNINTTTTSNTTTTTTATATATNTNTNTITATTTSATSTMNSYNAHLQ